MINPTATDYRYTGQRDEFEIGLYYYVARYYDPVVGRFISADTIVPQPGSSQAYDRFAYVNNNPINFNDPSGHAMQIDGGGSCVGILCLINKPDPDPPLIIPVPTPTISGTPTPTPVSSPTPLYSDRGESGESEVYFRDLRPIIWRMMDPFMGVYAMNPLEDYLPTYFQARVVFIELLSAYSNNGIDLKTIGNNNNPLDPNAISGKGAWQYLVTRSGYYPYSQFLSNMGLDTQKPINYEPYYLNSLMANPANFGILNQTANDIFDWLREGSATAQGMMNGACCHVDPDLIRIKSNRFFIGGEH